MRMCSIPGLPTPGSEVPVLITRVNLNPKCGLVELWADINDGRKPIYEQMREEIKRLKQTFGESEGNPGDLCLVQINETWHRARIVSIIGHNYNVFLIDQGQPHITTSRTLAWGQSDSFLLPPEIESCVLANVMSLEKNWSERATKFLKSLPGKRFNGLVQDVLMPYRAILLDVPIVSKHICKIGFARKIPMGQFKCFVLSCLHLLKGEASEICPIKHLDDAGCELETFDQYLYPELLTDVFETIAVTEVTDPLHIFCKLSIFSKELKKLSEQIQQYYGGNSTFGKGQPQACGAPCAARGINGKWYRSLLKQDLVASDGAVEVLHVDHGKTEFVPVGDIRPLHEKFLRMPVVTYLCSLEGVKENGMGWTVDEVDYLKSVLLHQTVVAKFEEHNITEDIYYVILYAADATCINKCFIEKEGFSTNLNTHRDSNVHNDPIPSTSVKSVGDEPGKDFFNKENEQANGHANGHLSPCSPSATQNVLREHVFPIGSAVNVKISCIESLAKFWCQTADNSGTLGLLMQDMQAHYASSRPQPLVESICVAQHLENGMWYRAKIIANHLSPIVDVRFIDYGETQKVPIQDLRPIDPGFLQLNAQAFQCCLYSLMNPANPTAVTWSDDALVEFQKFVDSVASSNIGLKCIVKAVMSDPQGLLLNVVDIETPFQSACKLLAQKCTQADAPMQVPLPPPVTSDSYNYSTHNIEVGGKEKVWVTRSETVNHFYCQLDRNSHLYDQVMENVKQLISQPQCTDHSLRLNSLCFARYTDNQWCRGQIIAVSPNLQVHFVDYGNTLVVNKSDICPFPIQASPARSVPVQAIPLGLFNVPADVPQEINKWFADHALCQYFTISVVAKDASGKLIVELYDGSLNVNVKVREGIAKVKQRKETGLDQQTHQQLSYSSKQPKLSVPREHCQTREHMNMSPLRKMTEHQIYSSSGMCAGAEQKIVPATPHISVPEGELGKTSDEGRKQTSSSARITDLPPRLIKQGLSAEVYISHFNNPSSFFVQLQKDENDIHSLLEKLKSFCDSPVDFNDLQIGDLVNAEFPDDSSWYRAVVRHKFEDSIVHVEFIDLGNEATIPCFKTSYLDKVFVACPRFSIPCTLGRLSNKHEQWDQEAISIFKRTTTENPEKTFACTFIKEKENVWDVILKDQNNVLAETFFHNVQTESNMTQLNCSEGNLNICSYKKPNIAQNQTEEVYASCIVGPHYFWCQYANTEDLDNVSRLAQEVGRAEQDMITETLGPGSSCLALFASDKQWYRAQVIRKTGNILFVLFIDYGNESEVDIKDVRSVPPTLLERAPQAFLCSLDGFDDSKGTWDDSAFDEFYGLLVDKLFSVTVYNMEEHLEIAVPQYAVKIECGDTIVHKVMEKYWKGFATEHAVAECPESETSQGGQTESNVTQPNCSERNLNICSYKKPNIAQNQTEEVYASCIVGPHYFWCQYANTEDLDNVSRLAQEVGLAEQDMMFTETLGAGSSCLALFASDKQWYRAQVIRKTGNILLVLFIDYGNESEVDIKDVRSVPPTLLERAPRAFLCSLDGFDNSKGTWDDSACDEFYGLLVDKLFSVTVYNMEEHLEIAVPQYAVKIECGDTIVNIVMEKYWKGFATEHAVAESPESETFQGGQTESNVTQPNCSERNLNICSYKKPNIAQNQTEEVYTSCIVGPHYFWCQYANTEDLDNVSRLAQEVGRAEQYMITETLGPGSSCLALFASDKQWYRAQVIRKTGNILFVLFIDYGNESEVDIKDVRSVPPTLLERAPRAFLCSLDGFDDSKGTWDDSACDEFYGLLVDKPFSVTVYNMEKHLEIAVPQYAVKIECGDMIVNKVMEKYWKGFATENAVAESPESETFQGGQTESNVTQLNCSEGNLKICSYKKPNIAQNQTEEVYASCIVGPHYFWCQYANTEDLDSVSRLAQEVGLAEQDMITETLGPGSSCLALFASDKQWYRAQVIRKTGNILLVLFIDYGNESEVDIKDVRSVPPTLLERAPRAFLCTLDGFDDSKGTWDDSAFDEFYDLLVYKPFSVTVYNMEEHLEIAVPQYAVKIECGDMIVNKVMEKYWKGFATEHAVAECPESETSQGGQGGPESDLSCPVNQDIAKSVQPTISESHFD